MDTDLEKQVKEQFEKLPAVVKQAIQSSDFETKLRSIGGKEGLHIDQIGDLQDETLLVMMGLSDPNEFAAHLEERLRLPADKAVSVASAVSNGVFMPIRGAMQEFMEHQETAAAAGLVQKTVQAAPLAVPAASVAPPAPKPDLSLAETMLQTKTVSTSAPAPAAKQEPPKATNYSADPYREPPL